MHPFMGIESWGRTGISVEESARRLQRIAYIDRQLMRIEAGHMVARPEYEVKGALACMVWQDSEHYDQLRTRCKQLRMSSAAFDKCQDTDLQRLMEAALNSANTLCLLTALFEIIKPEQIKAIQAYLRLAQPIVDFPTIHILKHQLIDREQQLSWGRSALDELWMAASAKERETVGQWRAYIADLLAAAGGLGEAVGKREPDEQLKVPVVPFELPNQSARDERFTSAIKKFKDMEREVAEQDNDEGHFVMMMYVRFFEMSPAEGVAHVHFSTEGKPWNFYYDTARHMWDEVRHSWFGEAALRLNGYDIYAVPNWTGWYDMASNLFKDEETYIHLTVAIEKAAMKYPPGKRAEWEFCRDVAKDPLMTTFQDFDWADEVVHAGYGQKWIIEDVFKGDSQKALEAARATSEKRAKYMAQFDSESGNSSVSSVGGY